MHISRKRCSYIFVLLVLCLVIVQYSFKHSLLNQSPKTKAQAPIVKDEVAPGFSLISIAGDTVSLSSFRDKKVVILDFWASYCMPCMLELPELEKFYENLNEEQKGKVELLGINASDRQEEIRKLVTKKKLSFPMLIDGGGKVSNLYQIRYVPSVCIINPQGKLIKLYQGFNPDIVSRLKEETNRIYPNTFPDSAANTKK